MPMNTRKIELYIHNKMPIHTRKMELYVHNKCPKGFVEVKFMFIMRITKN